MSSNHDQGKEAPVVAEQTVQVVMDGVMLPGLLSIPTDACGVVLFAHGSGSSRHSPRNRAVATTLQNGGLATLLIDLFTPEEELIDQHTAKLRFDVCLLALRLIGAAEWLARNAATAGLSVGYFGSSTGAAAALIAAAEHPAMVDAIVSRGGRPDLAGPALERVQAPTLLIVGGADTPVIGMNRTALDHLHCSKQLVIIPEATHLFEEPGTLSQVALLARGWFQQYLGRERELNA